MHSLYFSKKLRFRHVFCNYAHFPKNNPFLKFLLCTTLHHQNYIGLIEMGGHKFTSPPFAIILNIDV